MIFVLMGGMWSGTFADGRGGTPGRILAARDGLLAHKSALTAAEHQNLSVRVRGLPGAQYLCVGLWFGTLHG